MFVLAIGAMHMGLGAGSMYVARMTMARMTMAVPLFVAMGMPAMGAMVTIGTTFGFKSLRHRHHRHVHGAQHVGQHVVEFDFQVVGFELDGHMAVAQVVSGAGQRLSHVRCTR